VWAGSRASAPGVGHHLLSLRGRVCALLRPEGAPPGSIYLVRCRPYGRRPVLIRSRLRLAVRSPQEAALRPRAPWPRSRIPMCSTLRAWAFTCSPGLPPHEVPGTVTSLASRPAVRTRPFGLVTPPWASPLRPAVGSPVRMTIREGPVARLRSLPLGSTWAGHRPLLQRGEKGPNVIVETEEKSGSFRGGHRRGIGEGLGRTGLAHWPSPECA
jgi:hypothetical protein